MSAGALVAHGCGGDIGCSVKGWSSETEEDSEFAWHPMVVKNCAGVTWYGVNGDGGSTFLASFELKLVRE